MTATRPGVFEQLASRWDDTKNYLRRPEQWCADKLGEHMWSKQVEIMNSVVENRYTAVPSAHELGKSKAAANIISWWIDSHPPGSAFVVSTAPTAAQVAAVMWREVMKDHAKGKLPGQINRAGYPQWYIGDGELVGYGRKPSDYEDSAFNGIHARYVLVVIDEAGGVVEHLYNAIDSLVANQYGRVLAIGNPDDPGSHFAKICKPASGWKVIPLDGLRSPNFNAARIIGADPDKPRYPLTKMLMEAEGIPLSTEVIPHALTEVLIDPLWVEERIERWAGVNAEQLANLPTFEQHDILRRRTNGSALFVAKVRGEFPSSTATGVIPMGWVNRAVERWHDWTDKHGTDYGHVPNPTRHVVGVDVAYGGQDETAIARRFGDYILPINRFRLADTMETADEAAKFLHIGHSVAVVDVIGIGAGVYDALRRFVKLGLLESTVRIVPFNAGASTHQTDIIGEFKFKNDRAAAWWNMRTLLDPSRGSKIMLPDDERLIQELVAPKFKIMSGGVIQIESKDDIRQRLGRSTDSADAVIQAFVVEVNHGAIEAGRAYDYAQTAVNELAAGGAPTWSGYESFTANDMTLQPGYGGTGRVDGVMTGWDTGLGRR